MKIGKPVAELPPNNAGRPLKYQGIYEAVANLKAGQILPVESATIEEARNLGRCIRVYLLSHGHRINQRGTTVYITKNGA